VTRDLGFPDKSSHTSDQREGINGTKHPNISYNGNIISSTNMSGRNGEIVGKEDAMDVDK